MLETVQIRPYRNEDLPQVEALEARVKPYRPEDEVEVPAMFARALQAEQANDPRWMAPLALPPRSIAEEFDAFWIAEQAGETSEGLGGIVGVQWFRAEEILPASHPLGQEWQARSRVAELRRLRVVPERRGQGVGTRLCQAVLEWSHREGVRTLLVNTTTPQFPARQLYRKLGFEEVGFSFIGRYELVWMELTL